MERCFNIGVNLYDKRSEKLLFFFLLQRHINFHSVRYECGVGKVTVNGDCQVRRDGGCPRRFPLTCRDCMC